MVRVVMNGARKQLLTGAGRAGDKGRDVGRSYPSGGLLNLGDLLGNSYDVVKTVAHGYVLTQSDYLLLHSPAFDGFIYSHEQFIVRERLGNIVECPSRHRLDGAFYSPMPRQQNRLDIGIAIFDQTYEIDAVLITDAHIQYGQVNGSTGKHFCGFRNVRGFPDLIAVLLKQ